MMWWKILSGALVRQKRRMFLVALTVALGVSVASAMLLVLLDTGDKVNKELRSYGANIRVAPRAASLAQELYAFSQDAAPSGRFLREKDVLKIKSIFWANNIVDFAPLLEARASLAAIGEEVPLVGTWFRRRVELETGEVLETGVRPLKSWWEVEGRWAEDGEEVLLAGRTLARRLGVRVGGVLAVASRDGRVLSLPVVGLLDTGGPEDESLFASLGLVQELQGLGGRVSAIEVSALTTPENDLARRAARDPSALSLMDWETWYCTAYVGSIAYQIEEALPDSRAKPILQVSEAEGGILEKVQFLMLLITLLSIAGSTLGIANLVNAGVLARSREIGLLKALGASERRVGAQILSETLVTGLGGGVLGYAAGLGLAQWLGHTVFGSPIAFHPLVPPLILILIPCVVAVGSLPGLARLGSVEPARILKGR